MFFIYQVLIFLIIIFSPIILIFRFAKNKEHKIRFLEKFCFIEKKRPQGNLIWIHAASVGELMSVIPLVKKLEESKNINTILITTSTLSSSKIFENLKFKKTIHQFFPVDFIFFTSKFINYWDPKIAIFIDSEIWPCMYKNLKLREIPLVLLNARLTQRSYKRWTYFKNFSKNIFGYIDIAFPQNQETFRYLKKLNIKKIKQIGNLKFSDSKIRKTQKFSKSFLNNIKNRIIFCASSTHPNEEILICKAHISLRKKFGNLLTVIIPRHIDRVKGISEEIRTLGLKSNIRTEQKKINYDTDIYLVDTYGETKKFFEISKVAFIGGSFVKHGGQNPIEPARFKLNILHGPNIENFKDIYKLFDQKKISHKVNSLNQLTYMAKKLLTKKGKKNFDIKKIGNPILKRSIIEIKDILNNEIKKT